MNTLSRRQFLRGVGVAAGAAALAACATPTPQVVEKVVKETVVVEKEITTTPAPARPTLSGKVVFWAFMEYGFDDKFAAEMEKAYEAHSPGVDLEIVVSPEDAYGEKLAPALASGSGPDVFSPVMMDKNAWAASVLELTALIQGPDGVDLSQWDLDYLKTWGMIDNNYYGLPRDLYGGDGIMYNKALFDKAGVPYPKAGWTWSDVEFMVPKLTDKANRIYGIVVPELMRPDMFGLEIMSPDRKSVAGYFDSDAAIAAVRQWRRLCDYSPTVDQQKTEFQDVAGGGGGPQGAFLSGRVAMALDLGGALYTTAEQAGIKWGYVSRPLPDDPKLRHKPGRAYVTWGINKNTKNVAAAWDFLKWLTAKDGGAPLMAKAGYFIPYRDVLEAINYPKEILDVYFEKVPPEWGPPLIMSYWSVPCGGSVIAEFRNTLNEVRRSTEAEAETIVKKHVPAAQTALDSCLAKAAGGE